MCRCAKRSNAAFAPTCGQASHRLKRGCHIDPPTADTPIGATDVRRHPRLACLATGGGGVVVVGGGGGAGAGCCYCMRDWCSFCCCAIGSEGCPAFLPARLPACLSVCLRSRLPMCMSRLPLVRLPHLEERRRMPTASPVAVARYCNPRYQPVTRLPAGPHRSIEARHIQTSF